MTNTNDPLAPYHHPKYQSGTITTTSWGYQCTFRFSDFSGNEAMPVEPQLPTEVYGTFTADQLTLLHKEWESARVTWARAKLRRDVKPAAEAAHNAWRTWTQAEKGLDAAWAAMWDTEDNKWRSACLRLLTAQQQAEKAAKKYDDCAARLQRLGHDHQEHIPEDIWSADNDSADKIARGLGFDTSEWLLSDLDDYRAPKWSICRATASARVDDVIKHQNHQLMKVNRITDQETA